MNTLKKLSLTLLLALPLSVNAAPRAATPFTDAEIDQMLAPIALYPDTVLSHVLIAATVPSDVEAAAVWVERHPDLRGQEAVDAVDRYDWDPSVKALVAFPEVIERMDEDPDWTEDLGLAFLEQEQVVMDRVQVLRDRAYDNGNLEDSEHVRVVREREYIYIEPAASRVVYVPYYNPLYVYGSWWWASYPPHCWNWWAGRPAHYYHHSAFFWGVSYHLGPSWYIGAFNWPNRHVIVTRPHRNYTPSPGYSGRSMRRDVVHHDTRRPRDGARSWQRDPRGTRPSTPVAQGQRPVRRSWTDVRDGLTARREDSRRHDGATRSNRARGDDRVVRADPARRDDSRRRDDVVRRATVRSEPRGRSENRRQDDRVRSYERPQAPRTRPQPQPGREVRAVERAPQGAAVRAPAPRVESSGQSRGESRGGGSRSHGGSNSGGRGNDGGGTRSRSR